MGKLTIKREIEEVGKKSIYPNNNKYTRFYSIYKNNISQNYSQEGD